MLNSLENRWPSFPYVAPFVAFLLFLALQQYLPFDPAVEYPLRVVILTLVLLVTSRQVIDLRCSRWLQTVTLGILVFVIWVGPDILFPGYRHSVLFQNSLLGEISGKVPETVIQSPIALWSRIIRAVVLVPIIEELFWRAWLMRWLIDHDFQHVALGTYLPSAFWLTAVLFASEHGSYWEVGLAAGIIYNWWMVRTRSLADCILAHAVTNGALAIYVVSAGAWQYWM